MATESSPESSQGRFEVTADHPSRPTPEERVKVDPARTAAQVEAIVEKLGGPNVVGVVGLATGESSQPAKERELDPAAYGDMVYMFRKGRILVRDEDLRRVGQALGLTGSADIKGGINGLTVLEIDNAFDALSVVEGEFGLGVAYPDHVVHITGDTGRGSACPATEPFPPAVKAPFPTRHVHPDCDGRSVVVSLVDAGFDPQLAAATPWLAGVDGWPYDSYVPSDLGPYAGHGTFAAGVLRTMAPACSAYVHGFLPHGGAVFESDLIRDGFARALADAPDILSISAGTYTRSDAGMLGFRVAWEKFGSKGTVVVAAAGNDSLRKPFFPAADNYAVGVGALDLNDDRAYYSNHGSWVDCYALGSDHVNAYPRGTYRYAQPPMTGDWATLNDGLARWSGTSFATPLVAGVIAARMTWSGESGRLAADSVLRLARSHARVGVGAVVKPWMGCRPGWACGC